MIKLDVDAALKELEKKTYRDVQRETALKWGARAAATYQRVAEADEEDKLALWTIAEEFYHEAVEHAALVEGEEDLLKQLREAIHEYQDGAAESMGFNRKDVDVI